MNPKAFANAAALTAMLIYIISLASVAFFPDQAFYLYRISSHGLNIESQRSVTINFGENILGGLLWGGFVWIIFYFLISLYNHFK